MKKYVFGLTAEEVNISEDFDEKYDSTLDNYNPYNTAYFNDHPCVTDSQSKITSIPSPYARMHITDLAFQELNCGQNLLMGKETGNPISFDYSKALSHCLDIYEILFLADEIDLAEKGITVQKINLSKKYEKSNSNNKYIDCFLETLELFRKQYRKVIDKNKNDKSVPEYCFDFNSLYLLKCKGKTFAATSPFTGFFAKSDCDLAAANIKVNDADGRSRSLLSANSSDWRDLTKRSLEFRIFMYRLLNDSGTKLGRLYCSLFEAVKNSLSDTEKNQADNDNFADVYKKYNISGTRLQQIKGKDIYLRPDNIDSSYLRFLLFLDQPADLIIKQGDYDAPLDERKFDGELTRWIGANDILSDALFVLPYDINHNYLSVPYEDQKDGKLKKRCLLPVKLSVLEHLPINIQSLQELVPLISIQKKEDNSFVVRMKIELKNGGVSYVRREYHKNDVNYPDGSLITNEEMIPFALGIYPFVRSETYDNIYKVLFYNGFSSDTGSLLKFYSIQNNRVAEFDTKKIIYNQTDIYTGNGSANCWYYHVEDKTNGIDVIELNTHQGNALIVPRLIPIVEQKLAGIGERQVIQRRGNAIVAIDLGTSNTYVTYSIQDGDDFSEIKELITTHDGWKELTFMQETCGREDLNEAVDKNRDDLYLRNSDEKDDFTSDWLANQLCEFIPSRLVSNKDSNEGYSFPIPSVINSYKVDCSWKDSKVERIPLINSTIPFAYYEIGSRGNDFDKIAEGEFKWFRGLSKDGKSVEENTDRKHNFESFLTELLFIVRSHLLSEGYKLNEVKLLWTYPLSFGSELVRAHSDAWDNAYLKFFNPNFNQAQIRNYVLSSNESIAPIFECITDFSNVSHLTLLLDIGGGSTDIIGFKNYNPLFISSFGFAGNALYLSGMLNHQEQPQHNLLRKHILSDFKGKDIFSKPSKISRTKIIDKNENISALMNYGFSKYGSDFKGLFDNPGLKFMLQFHNAAIIYHVAQLCKLKSSDEFPVAIYLTGNGSKLFDLNNEKERFFQDIFAKFYSEKSVSVETESPNYPKAATAHGALKGYKESLDGKGLTFNRGTAANRVIMLGDNDTCYDVTQFADANIVGDATELKTKIENNVKDFIEMFYTLIDTNHSPIEKEKLLAFVEFVKEDSRVMSFDSRRTITDSMFFQYVSLVMEKISAELVKRGY